MGDRWLPWSAASLASGAVLMVLGSFSLPLGLEVGALVASVEREDSQWMIAAVAFMLGSVGMTLGLPAVHAVLPLRDGALGMAGLWIWSFGTIGTAGLGALLVFFRAAAQTLHLGAADVEQLARDPGLIAFVVAFLGAFYLGEVIVCIVLWRGRTVARWVPLLLLAHIAMVPVNQFVPADLQGAQSILIGVALMGIAKQAADDWGTARNAALLR